MNVENYIESQYRELLSCSQINAEYSDLYKSFRNQKLREMLRRHWGLTPLRRNELFLKIL